MVSHFNKISIWLSVEFGLLVYVFLQSKALFIHLTNTLCTFCSHRLFFKECFFSLLHMGLDKPLPVLEKKKKIVHKTKTKAKTKNPKFIHIYWNQSFSLVLSPRSPVFSIYAYEYATIHYYRNHEFSKISLPKKIRARPSLKVSRSTWVSKKIWNDLGLGKLLMIPFWLKVLILYNRKVHHLFLVLSFWSLFWRINELSVLKH